MIDKELKKPKVEQMPEGNSTKTEPRDKDRRCFIKKAIVAAPIILTVTSRPVWARNCTASGLLSGNLSDNEGPLCGCCPPGDWFSYFNNSGDWEDWETWKDCNYNSYITPPHPEKSKFDDVFCCADEELKGMKLLDVLNSGNEFAIHSVTALYNSLLVELAGNYSFGYPPEKVIEMVQGACINEGCRLEVTEILAVVNLNGCYLSPPWW